MKIREAVVVEGRDDQAALSRALDCCSIATHGFGITKETLALIKKAYEEEGIIIFTDPDHSGRRIRERLTKLFPQAKQAFLTMSEAEKGGDIGIENASPEAIRAALLRAAGPKSGEEESSAEEDAAPAVSEEDLFRLGLTGREDSMKRRESAGKVLGLGGGNSRAFLKKLRFFRVSLKELEKACQEYPRQTR